MPSPPSRSQMILPLLLVLSCCLIEATLLLADHGLFQSPPLRRWAYENGAFWAGLLADWRPNYTAQPYVMFLSHGFLHGGLLHLGVNMVTLWSLARPVIMRQGTAGFALIYVTAMIGGGLGFGLVTPSTNPMVGASGALFGLAGALVIWNLIDRRAFGLDLWPVLQVCLILIAMNAGLWWAFDGLLAWAAHLGGFAAGAATALALDREGRV